MFRFQSLPNGRFQTGKGQEKRRLELLTRRPPLEGGSCQTPHVWRGRLVLSCIFRPHLSFRKSDMSIACTEKLHCASTYLSRRMRKTDYFSRDEIERYFKEDGKKWEMPSTGAGPRRVPYIAPELEDN